MIRLSEKRKVEAEMGYYIGICISVLGSSIALFFVDFAWYFKAFSILGTVCIIGVLLTAFFKIREQWKRLDEAEKELEDF